MKKAIVLSAFGSTEPTALQPFLDTVKEVGEAFPACDTHLVFTSPTIRDIWHNRTGNKTFRAEQPQIPELFYNVQTPLSVLADLQAKGYKQVVVQPLYMVEGTEFYDLRATVNALRSIVTFRAQNTPFPTLALGRPFLGMNSDTRDYHQDIQTMAEALKDDISQARKYNQALVYAGHGSPRYATPAYTELEAKLQELGDIPVFFATLEGWPDLPSLVTRLQTAKIKKILLKSFCFTCGKHSLQDIAGEKADSWLTVLRGSGFDVQTELNSIGSRPQVRRILVQHILDAATEAGIDL